MKKSLHLLLSALLLTVCSIAKAGETPVWTASAQGYANAEDVTSIKLDDYISVSFDIGTNKSFSTKYYDSGAALRCYGGNTITFSGADVNITSIAITYGTGETSSSNSNTISSNVGTFDTNTWSGEASQVVLTVSGTSGHRRIATIQVSYTGADEVIVQKPVITPSAGIYSGEQEVTITVAEGLTAYYTVNGGAEQVYTAPFTIKETSTIVAYAQDADGNKSAYVENAIIIANGNGTAESPYDVASALELVRAGMAPSEKVHVTGVVGDSTKYSTNGSGGLIYFIHQEGVEDSVQIYYGLYLGGEKFTEETMLSAGDSVVVYGNLTLYKTVVEFDQNSILTYLKKADGTVIDGNEGGDNGDDDKPATPTYTTIAEAKAAATATQVASVLKLDNVVVAFSKGSNTYVTDGTDGFLLYGSGLGLSTGQNVSLTASGNLYLYNGLPELGGTSIDELTINSEGNEVKPVRVEAAEIIANPLKYSSVLVTLEAVSFDGTEWNNRNITMLQDGEELILRDNWSIATDYAFKNGAEDTYNVTGFVAIYNNDVQLYPRSAGDIEYITSLLTPASAWSVDTETITSIDQTVTATFTTNSDGAVTYESSDENVATVDAEGNITIIGGGTCEIKATTAETTTYLASVSTLKLIVKILSGDGTQENPYTYADVNILYDDSQASEKVWVEGYIVGYATGSNLNSNVFFDADEEKASNTNFLIAASADVKDASLCLPVQLPTAVRDSLSLKNKPENLGKSVKLFGTIEKYFGVCGIKNVSDYVIEGAEDDPTGIATVSADEAEQAIYTITGVKVKEVSAPGIYIINGKKVLVK